LIDDVKGSPHNDGVEEDRRHLLNDLGDRAMTDGVVRGFERGGRRVGVLWGEEGGGRRERRRESGDGGAPRDGVDVERKRKVRGGDGG
jgi:hypothetical protein